MISILILSSHSDNETLRYSDTIANGNQDTTIHVTFLAGDVCSRMEHTMHLGRF